MLSRPVVKAAKVGWSKTVVGFKLAGRNFPSALMAIFTELVGRD